MSKVLTKEQVTAIVLDACDELEDGGWRYSSAAVEEVRVSHEALRDERDAARRLAVHQHLRFWPDCEVSPDPVRSRRHTAFELFGLSIEEAARLFPEDG